MKKQHKKSAPTKKRFNKHPKKIVAKKKPAVKNSMALATISYNDIVRPESFKSELTLISACFPKEVLAFITRETPKKYIFKREGPDGKMFDYVAGWYAKKCLNHAFGFNHSFEIKSREICGTSAIVEGRLIINDPKTGKEILHKDDIGGHKIRFLKGQPKTAENAVDVANDYKSAVTDATKRAMVQIGFFSDVYGPNEAREDGNYINGKQDEPQQPSQPAKTKVVQAQIVQTDYKAKLDDYLMNHPKGPFTTAEKIRFIKQQTGQFVDYVKISQQQAQMILANLIRNQK